MPFSLSTLHCQIPLFHVIVLTACIRAPPTQSIMTGTISRNTVSQNPSLLCSFLFVFLNMFSQFGKPGANTHLRDHPEAGLSCQQMSIPHTFPAHLLLLLLPGGLTSWRLHFPYTGSLFSPRSLFSQCRVDIFARMSFDHLLIQCPEGLPAVFPQTFPASCTPSRGSELNTARQVRPPESRTAVDYGEKGTHECKRNWSKNKVLSE